NTVGGLNGGLDLVGGLNVSAHSQVDDSLIVRQSAASVRRTPAVWRFGSIRQSATPCKGGGRRTSPANGHGRRVKSSPLKKPRDRLPVLFLRRRDSPKQHLGLK